MQWMKTIKGLVDTCLCITMEIISWYSGRCTLKELDIFINLSKVNNGVVNAEKIP